MTPPPPPPPPQQQYPRHIYDDLTPAARFVAEDMDRRIGELREVQEWTVDSMQAMARHWQVELRPPPHRGPAQGAPPPPPQ